MRVLLLALVLLGATSFAAAQEPAAAGPKQPFNATLTKISGVDLERGALQYTVVKLVLETRTKTIAETIIVDGKPQSVTREVTYTVSKPVFETVELNLQGATLSNAAGKKVSLAEIAKKIDLKGHDVVIAHQEEIDPYYLKFLSKDIWIITPAPLPAAPLPQIEPMPVPVPVPVPVPAAP